MALSTSRAPLTSALWVSSWPLGPLRLNSGFEFKEDKDEIWDFSREES